jgi:hypothetical protein
MADHAEEIKEMKVRVYDLSALRLQIDQEVSQLNMRIAELSKASTDLNGQPIPVEDPS